MTIFLVFLALFVFAGVASALGWTPDTRDRNFTIGAMLNNRPLGGHRGG